LHELWLGSEGALGVIVEAVLKIHRLPETVIGEGFSVDGVSAGLEIMRKVMQAGVRRLVMRLYDPEDSAFNGYDLADGHCMLVVATAGPAGIAQAEAELAREMARGATPQGEAPWQRWLKHRFDLSVDRLNAFLAPDGAYLDTIEIAAPWTSLPELHVRVKSAIAVGGLALCHFSHAYPQGCCAYFSFGGSGATEQVARAEYGRAWEGAMSAALELGATIGHHHGVGQVRARWVAAEMGGWMKVWQAVREGIDPMGIMNRKAVGGAP
ncbi:MAG TPA: FAD-linked oxidase C-terminal domain-containing protein, partial [Patescibacteria group bacterium]|nr:FAD-linked oxidase C-terminal domain-containing protein [Patescibacteria group bacterium]